MPVMLLDAHIWIFDVFFGAFSCTMHVRLIFLLRVCVLIHSRVIY